MKKLLLLAALAVSLLVPAAADAHPLGNFTTNRYAGIEVSAGRIYVLYVLDLAEIPTYQARPEVERLGRGEYGRRLAARIGAGLVLSLNGEPHRLRELRRALAFPRGAGGLATTRLEVVYDAGPAGAPGLAAALRYEDGNFPGRVGWREVTLGADEGARVVAASVPSRSVSRALRAYPQDLLQSPPDVTSVTGRVEPGSGAGTPPVLLGEQQLAAPAHVSSGTESGFAALVSKNDLGAGVVVLSLLAALFWGAAHALTPGHGKAIVAAYLVGSRGTARHALLLGLVVAVTHTIGVFALGLVTLTLSELVVPETLYPWLNLVSALLVVGVGLAVLRSRLPRRRHGHEHAHSHQPEGRGLRRLLAVGVSGGLLPCPTALVVLLAAISLHRVGYGLVLILAFSVGLAATVSGIGLLAVTAKRAFGRLSFQGPVVRVLPAVSALVVVGLGLAMTARALPTVV